MHQLQSVFSNQIKMGLERKSATSPARWAELYRVMSGEVPGPWKFDKFPWLREMHNSKAPINIGKKAAQVGFTEAVLNITFCRMDILGQDCLYILPTSKPAAFNFSTSRVDSAIELSPHLTNLFSNIKNIQHKKAGSANLFIRGCRSRTDLKSDPISLLVFDELDEMNEDLVSLGELRCSGQEDYQIWKISTPIAPNKKIDFEYTHSTQEHFMFKCPSCGKTIEFKFPESIKIIGESHRDPDCSKSHYICYECGKILPQEGKPDYLGKGFWEPFGDKRIHIRGFHINQMYSFIRSPEDIARAWLEGLIKKSAEQEFFNSRLGLPFVAEGTYVKAEHLQKIIGTYASGPQKGLVGMGVDIGRNRHHVVIQLWGVDRFGSDVNMRTKSKILLIKVVTSFDELAQLMREFQVRMAVFDSAPEYHKTHDFAIKFAPHVKLCTYNTNRASKALLKIPDPMIPEITVHRTLWIETALSRIIEGRTELPKDYPDEFELNLQSIFKRYGEDQHGNDVSWYESNGDDHFAHALTYSEITLPLLAALQTNKNIEVFL